MCNQDILFGRKAVWEMAVSEEERRRRMALSIVRSPSCETQNKKFLREPLGKEGKREEGGEIP